MDIQTVLTLLQLPEPLFSIAILVLTIDLWRDVKELSRKIERMHADVEFLEEKVKRTELAQKQLVIDFNTLKGQTA